MHNQCKGCGELFNSVYAFDKHRAGSYGVPDPANPGFYLPSKRRCLTVEEMKKTGMDKNSSGFWVSEPLGDAKISPDHPPRIDFHEQGEG